MSTWTAELINLLFHLIPKRHRYDIRSSYQWHRVPWYAGRNSANPRWRARKPRLVHAGFVAEPKNNQPHFFIHFKLLIEMEKLLEDLSSLGESLQNSTTNEAIIQLHQFLQKHLYVKDIVEFHGRYAVKLNNNLTLYYNDEITHR